MCLHNVSYLGTKSQLKLFKSNFNMIQLQLQGVIFPQFSGKACPLTQSGSTLHLILHEFGSVFALSRKKMRAISELINFAIYENF